MKICKNTPTTKPSKGKDGNTSDALHFWPQKKKKKAQITEGRGNWWFCYFSCWITLNAINMPKNRTVGGSIDAKDNSSSILKLATSRIIQTEWEEGCFPTAWMETDGNLHLSITPVNLIPVPCFHFYYAKKEAKKHMWLRSYPLCQMSPRVLSWMKKTNVLTNKKNKKQNE